MTSTMRLIRVQQRLTPWHTLCRSEYCHHRRPRIRTAQASVQCHVHRRNRTRSTRCWAWLARLALSTACCLFGTPPGECGLVCQCHPMKSSGKPLHLIVRYYLPCITSRSSTNSLMKQGIHAGGFSSALGRPKRCRCLMSWRTTCGPSGREPKRSWYLQMAHSSSNSFPSVSWLLVHSDGNYGTNTLTLYAKYIKRSQQISNA